jgi:hypothetical protein
MLLILSVHVYLLSSEICTMYYYCVFPILQTCERPENLSYMFTNVQMEITKILLNCRKPSLRNLQENLKLKEKV